MLLIIFCICFFYIIHHNTGKPNLFEVRVEQIEKVEIRNGDALKEKTFIRKNDIKKVICLIDSFRYREVEKATDVPGWSYMLVITLNQYESTQTIGYSFTEDSIRINDVWYKGEPGYFSELIKLVDGS